MANLTVAIAAAGRADLLQRTLKSLEQCQKPAGFRGVVLVENGPTQKLQGVASDFQHALQLRYRHIPQPSKSKALNLALEMIEDGLVCFFDDDVRFAPQTLMAYAAAAAAEQSGLFLGGPAFVDYEQAPPQWLRRCLPMSARGWQWHGDVGDVSGFLGFNWAAFASDLRAAGGFDAGFGPGGLSQSTVGDETDMQKRLRAMGAKAQYVPDAHVWHYVPVERCCPQWAIARKRQHGIAQGLAWHGEDRRVLGYPLWMTTRWIRTLSKLVLAHCWPSAAARVTARCSHALSQGLLQGVTLQRQQSRIAGQATLEKDRPFVEAERF